MSQVIKGLRRAWYLHNCGFIIRRASNTPSKEIIQQAPLANTDLLLTNLKSAKSIHNIFELVNAHHLVMNNRHSMQALRTLFVLHKSSRGEVSTQDILKHRDFERLCNQLRQQAGIIELRDTVDALKILTYINVPSDSLVYQVLLQLVRHSVNQFTLPQIIFLDFLLKQVKSTPLIEALQIALPIVFEVQLPVKMDKSKVSYLAEYWYYISRKNVSDKCIELMINAILRCNEEWDAKTTISILWSTCDMKPNWRFKPLLDRAFHSMMVHMGTLSYEDLDTSMSKLVQRYSNKMNFYYKEDFFDACSTFIIDSDFGFEAAVYTLKKFLRLNHVHNELLDYISGICCQNPDLMMNGDPLHISIIISSIAMTEYKPKNWVSLEKIIMNIQNFDDYLEKDFLLSFATAMAILDLYNKDILKKALEEKRTPLYTKQFLDYENMLLLYQAIKVFRPELSHLLPSNTYLEKVASYLNSSKDDLLEGCLHKILGGEKYVKTDVRTRLFHCINYVVLLRKGGYPVAINTATCNLYLEDIEIAPESQIVAILALYPHHYALNCRRLKGSTSLMIKTLEARGCVVVPVCMELWTSLPEYEKIPYLAEIIKSKSDYKECLSNLIS